MNVIITALVGIATVVEGFAATGTAKSHDIILLPAGVAVYFAAILLARLGGSAEL